MADSKTTALTEDTSVSSSDLGYTIEDPAGTPVSKKATWLNILKGAALGVLTSDGDLFTRTSGALARLTRANLAADAAFTGTYAPLNPTYSAYTPTVSQNGTRTTSAMTARYMQMGKQVNAYGWCTVSNSGTAGNVIEVTPPVAALASQGTAGTGYIYDSSAGQVYMALVLIESGKLNFRATNLTGGGKLGAAPSFEIANGDIVAWNITYEAS